MSDRPSKILADTGAGTFAHVRDVPPGPVERALTDLREAETLAPALAFLRDPSARRPWREVVLDPYARAELDDTARQEYADRVEYAPGAPPDAARPGPQGGMTERGAPAIRDRTAPRCGGMRDGHRRLVTAPRMAM